MAKVNSCYRFAVLQSLLQVMYAEFCDGWRFILPFGLSSTPSTIIQLWFVGCTKALQTPDLNMLMLNAFSVHSVVKTMHLVQDDHLSGKPENYTDVREMSQISVKIGELLGGYYYGKLPKKLLEIFSHFFKRRLLWIQQQTGINLESAGATWPVFN